MAHIVLLLEMSLNNRQSLRNTLDNFHVEELRFENQLPEIIIIDLIFNREIYTVI